MCKNLHKVFIKIEKLLQADGSQNSMTVEVIIPSTGIAEEKSWSELSWNVGAKTFSKTQISTIPS